MLFRSSAKDINSNIAYWTAFSSGGHINYGDSPESACSGTASKTLRFYYKNGNCYGGKDGPEHRWSLEPVYKYEIKSKSDCSKGYRQITKKSGGTFSVLCTEKPKDTNFAGASVGSLGGNSSTESSNSSASSASSSSGLGAGGGGSSGGGGGSSSNKGNGAGATVGGNGANDGGRAPSAGGGPAQNLSG